MPLEEAAARLTTYMAAAQAMAYSAIESQSNELAHRGYKLKCVGIIDSESRKQLPLASILASHALIHAADGDHFRNALAAAAIQAGLKVCRMPARALEEHAAASMHLQLGRLKNAVNEFGRQIGPPWGADQKKAAPLSWLIATQEAAAPARAMHPRV